MAEKAQRSGPPREHPIRVQMMELQAAGADVAAMSADELCSALDGDLSHAAAEYHRRAMTETGTL